MFDYQAGEKYRLTLIMVALAGVIAGVFFTVLLMPAPEQAPRHHRERQPWMNDPDVNGGGGHGGLAPGAAEAAAQAPATAPSGPAADPTAAKSLIESWLPLAWDLSAGTAKA